MKQQQFSILFLFLFFTLTSYAQKECVIIIQGYEEADEHFASNGADAAETAFRGFPGGAKVTRLAPKKTNKSNSVKANNLYTSKEDLLKKLKTAICDPECEDVVLSFIGHGMGGSGGLYTKPRPGTPGGMWVGEVPFGQGQKRSTFITSDEIAAIINECKKEIKLLDVHCYAEHMIDGILRAVTNKDLIKVGLGSSEDDQESKFHWNDILTEAEKNAIKKIKEKYKKLKDDAKALGDDEEVKRLEEKEKEEIASLPTKAKGKQFYDFLKEFLKDYYKIIGDPNVMREIKKKAEELKKKAEQANIENEKKRTELRNKITALEGKVADCDKAIAELGKKVETLENEIKKIDPCIEGLKTLTTLKGEKKTLEDKLKNYTSSKRRKGIKAIKDGINKIWKDLPRNQQTKEKADELSEAGKEKIGEFKEEFDAKKKALNDKLKENLAKRKEIAKKLKDKGVSVAYSSSQSTIDKAKQKLEDKKKKKQDEINKIKAEIETKKVNCDKLKEELKKLKEQLAAIVDHSAMSPIMELVLHESFKSAKANTKSSTAVEPVSPVGNQDKITLPNKKLKKIGIIENTGDKRYGAFKYYLHFYKVIDAITKKCVIVGYVADYVGTPIAPLKSIDCKEDCSLSKAKFNIGGQEYIIELKQKADKSYDAKVNGKTEKYRELAYNYRIIPPGERGQRVAVWTKPDGNYTVILDDQEHENVTEVEGSFNIEDTSYSIVHIAHDDVLFTIGNTSQLKHDMIFYSLYDDDGFRVGEAALLIEENNISGSLWLERNDAVYPIIGTFNIYDETFEANSQTPEGLISIAKNSWYGWLETYWTSSKEIGRHEVQPKTIYLPFITNLTVETTTENKGKMPQLKWDLNTSFLPPDIVIDGFGVRVVRYNELTGDKMIADFNRAQTNFIDYNVLPNIPYSYHISTFIQQPSDCGCKDFSNYPFYSYSEVIDWEGEENVVIIETIEGNFPLIPVIGGAVLGVGVTAIVISNSDDENTNQAPQANCNDIIVELVDGSVNITTNDIDNNSSEPENVALIFDLSSSFFTCSDIGINPIVLTVTDSENQTDECTANVTVLDNEIPELQCTDLTFEYTGNAISINSDDVLISVTDNCSITSITVNPNEFIEIGSYDVTVTAVDAGQNQTSCTAIVTITGNMPPAASCNDLTLPLDETGTAIVSVEEIDAGSTDTDGTITEMILSQSTFNCDDIGVQQVTFTVTDNENAQATCVSTITIIDDLNPNIQCTDITLPYTGEPIVLTSDMVVTESSDNCAVATIEIEPLTLTGTGIFGVIVTVTDGSGNQTLCNAQVTVSDNNPPTALCTDITIILNDEGFASILPDDVNNGSSDADGTIEILELDQTLFTCENVGENQITLTVTDDIGDTDFCFSNITVVDDLMPAISCSDLSITLPLNGTVNIMESSLNVETDDNCGVGTITIEPNEFSSTGIFTVITTVVDVNGNESTCESTITITDDINPTISCLDIEVLLDNNGEISIAPNDVVSTVTDNDAVADLQISQSDFDCSSIGQNSVVVTAIDNSGNSNTCDAIVTVVDNVLPTANCQSFLITIDLDGNPVQISATNVDAGSDDNCSLESVSISQTEFTLDDLGENEVTLTAIDASGNEAECIAIVTVVQQDFPNFVAIDDAAFSPCNVDVIISALSNDLNADEASIISISEVPDNVTVESIDGQTLQINGFATENFTFTYTAEDQFGQTDGATVSILISLIDIVVVDDAITGNWGEVIEVQPLLNDTGEGLSLGTVTLTSGTAEFTFDSSTISIDNIEEGVSELIFDYSVVDDCGQESTGQIIVTITIPEIVAIEDEVSISCDVTTIVNVLDNDTGQAIEITEVSNIPENVLITIANGALEIQILPEFTNPNFQFNYTITDASNNTATTTVTVTLDFATLTLADDLVDVEAGTNTFTLNPIANDVLPNADMDVTFVTGGAYTIEQVGNDLIFTFTEILCEAQTIEYSVEGFCLTAETANIFVNVMPQDLSAIEDAAFSISGENVLLQPLLNDIGDNISITDITQPTSGQTVLSSNNVIYSSNPGFTGFDSFDYTITDQCGQTTTGTVNITVEEVPCNYSFDLQTTEAICELPNGTAELIITPPGNFSVTWSTGETGSSAFSFTPGDHNFVATNLDDACQLTGNFTIGNFDPDFGSLISTQDQVCNTPGSVTFDVNVEPGTSVVLYILENGSPIFSDSYISSQQVTSDFPTLDNYTYEFWSPNIGPDCVQSGSFSIQQDQVELDLIVSNQQQPSGPTNNDGLISVFVPNATLFPVTFLLNGVPFESDFPEFTFNNLGEGDYEIVVTDNNGCGSVPILVSLFSTIVQAKKIAFSIGNESMKTKTQKGTYEQPGSTSYLSQFRLQVELYFGRYWKKKSER